MVEEDVVEQMNEYEELKRSVERIGDKLEGFMLAMPNTYVQQTENNAWRSAIESRVNTLETDYKQGREWAVKEHQGLVEAINGSERRIVEKLDTMNTKIDTATNATNTKIDNSTTRTWEQRVTHIFATFGWIMTLAVLLIGYVLSHLPAHP